MTNIPVNSPDTFGDAEQSGTAATIDLVAQAPKPQPGKQRPAVKRVLQGNRANLILFTFLPGPPDFCAGDHGACDVYGWG